MPPLASVAKFVVQAHQAHIELSRALPVRLGQELGIKLEHCMEKRIVRQEMSGRKTLGQPYRGLCHLALASKHCIRMLQVILICAVPHVDQGGR